MDEGEFQVESGREPVYWRITGAGRDANLVSLIEIEPKGNVTREIDTIGDGTPVRITRPGEYGQWNDSPYPATPIGSPEFLAEWGAIGSEISRDEFEAIYSRADAALPAVAPFSRRERLVLVLVGVIALVLAVAFLRWIGFIT